MKKILFLMFFVSSFSFSSENWTCVTEDAEFAPAVMGYGVDFMTPPGIAVEAIKAIGEKLGINIKMKRMPWSRALDETKHGNADCVFLASFKLDRMEIGVYPMKGTEVNKDYRFLTSSYVFYKKKGRQIDFDGKAIIGNYKYVVVPRGYSVTKELKDLNIKFDEVNHTKQSFLMLDKERTDLIATLEETGDSMVEELKLQGSIVNFKTPIINKPYYVIISHQVNKKNPELVKKFFEEIKTFRENHYLKSVLKYTK